MTMVSSGPISLGGNATTGGLNQSINIELGQSATATISLNDSNVRTLLGKSSGAISLNDAYGKANQFAFTISSNQTNANLRTLAVNAGWNETSKVVATISSGVYVSSNSTGTSALIIDGSFPNGVELTNNGFIIGMGGAGGKGQINGTAGGSGGTALSVSSAITITNNGTIGGGGGGGQGGPNSYFSDKYGSATIAGAGGGGGRTGTTNSAAGAGGDGYPGNTFYPVASAAGQGTLSGGGGGGASSTAYPNRNYGGSGGNWGAGGGGWSGTTVTGWFVIYPAAAGAGGAAVSGNSNITWVATGTRLGAIA
jgi:hypothetical protein